LRGLARGYESASNQEESMPDPAVPPYVEQVRIGTLVNGLGPVSADSWIRQILPHGFESFSITFWQTTEGVDLAELAKRVKDALGGSGAVISSLGVFGNPLETRPKDLETVAGWRRAIDAARLFGCDIVAGFAGRLLDRPIDASVPRFKEVFGELGRRARDQGVRLAFENCDMGGTWQGGDWNMAHTPAAWEMMFDAVPLDNLGLEWEPSHQLGSLCDPMAQLRRYVKRVFHVHGKDATVKWDVLREHGLRGNQPWVFHRHPGFGDSDWTAIISELRGAGFKGSIDIEGWHDPIYRGELEMMGQVHALNHLKTCRGGAWVPNPR
jgi:sugar phosphate isomerase/epimerase